MVSSSLVHILALTIRTQQTISLLLTIHPRGTLPTIHGLQVLLLNLILIMHHPTRIQFIE